MSEENNPELDFLNEEDEIEQSLDIGFIEGRWYYGMRTNRGHNFLIYSDKTIEKDKYKCPSCEREVETSKVPTKCPCGRKGNFDRIFPSKFKSSAKIGNIAPLWSKPYAKEWIEGRIDGLDKKKLFEEIKERINFFMDFGDNKCYPEVQACWVMATYVYPLFYWFPNLLFKGPSGSGKSKNARVLMYMSFRGYDLGAAGGIDPAQLYRTLEGNKGTVFIDEFEKNEKDESQKLVNQILNAGATRDSYIIRNVQEEDKDWCPKKFPIFCPKLVCNISGINPTSMRRFIPFELLRSSGKKSNNKEERPEEKEKFEFIRNRMYPLMLDNWKEIKQIEHNLKTCWLGGGDEDNWRPILTLAKWIGEDIFESIKKEISNFCELQIEETDIEEMMFREIYKQFCDKESIILTPKEIAGFIIEELDFVKSSSSWVGWKLRRYNFKKGRNTDKRFYKFSKVEIIHILDVYFGGYNIK